MQHTAIREEKSPHAQKMLGGKKRAELFGGKRQLEMIGCFSVNVTEKCVKLIPSQKMKGGNAIGIIKHKASHTATTCQCKVRE